MSSPWSFDEFSELPCVTIETDLHCASGTTSTDHEFFGVAAPTVLELAPPAPRVTHVMAWAEYGYSANLHNIAAPWTEQRHCYQEE
ncbi:hypothetical protein [Streptomyces sp. NBC_01343]|uniref:hypothetical protein n=1 Tax=Streptomyces sp. NBC_01343 TaxID=2903832 RepID=UPI002E0EA4F1